MMALYRSLVYRELKLTWKHYLLFLVLYVLMVGLFTFPFIIIQEENLFKTIGLEEVFLKMFGSFLAVLGALTSGTPNNIQKIDVNSGWKRYSYSLPVTAGEKAMSDLIVKLVYFILFGLLATVSAVIMGSKSGYGVFCFTLNIYLIMSAVFWIFDAIENGSVVLGLNSAVAKIITVIAVPVMIFLLKLRVSVRNNSAYPSVKKYGIVDLAEHRLSLIFSVFFFVIVCIGYYLIMRKAYERREA